MQRRKYLSLLFVIGVLFFTGCSTSDASSTSSEPTNTPVIVEPTATLAPTNTPEPTATPIVYQLDLVVVDEAGEAVPEARIIQGTAFEVTDETGMWSTSLDVPEWSGNVWAQGMALQEVSYTLEPGDNSFEIQLALDPKGLQLDDLAIEGYTLVYVEDFQDGIADCEMKGNGNVFVDESDPENLVMLVDIRGLDSSFTCSFGPVDLENAILEMEFLYPEIQYTDFVDGDTYSWQGYSLGFRDYFEVEGYPLQAPWGPTLQILDTSTDEWLFPVTVRQDIFENRWYTLNTTYDGSKVSVRMDGVLRFNYLNPPTMINSDPAYFGAFTNSYIQFDNIKMWVPTEDLSPSGD